MGGIQLARAWVPSGISTLKHRVCIQTKIICVKIFSHTVSKGSLRHSRQSPAVWPGLQPCHTAWEPCHPRDVCPLVMMVFVLHGWADTPGQRGTGRLRDTLGQAQGHPKELQLWVTRLGAEQEEKQRAAKHHHKWELAALWDNTLSSQARSNRSWCKKTKDKKDMNKHMSEDMSWIPMLTVLSKNIFFLQEMLEGKDKRNLMCLVMNKQPQSQKTKMGKIKLISILVRLPLEKTPGSDAQNAFNHNCLIKQDWAT